MSRATETRDLLHSASQKLEELAPAVNGEGEAEEPGQIRQANQADEEAQQAQTNLAMSEKAMEAEQIRQLAKSGLDQRASNAGNNMELAEQIQKEICEAVSGTTRGDEMFATAGKIRDLIEESKTGLAQAAGMADKREQAEECQGLIAKAGEAAEQAANTCRSLKEEADQYAGAL